MRIIEIIGRSDQGITRPFICRGEDKELYYVKGQGAGYRSLCCEWVAGELARRWGLPIAPFSIVDVPAILVNGSMRNDIWELGSGPAFGSRLVEDANELRWGDVTSGEIPEDLQAKILIFDWWVANRDRMLSDIGGNPNLLWSGSEKKLCMIDHNLAFSSEIPPTIPEFAELHVFGSTLLNQEATFWGGEKEESKAPLLQATVELTQFWGENDAALEKIWSALPEQWTDNVPDFILKDVRSHLAHVDLELEDFWGLESEEKQMGVKTDDGSCM